MSKATLEVRYKIVEPDEDCHHDWMPPQGRIHLTPTAFGWFQRDFQRCCYCGGVRDTPMSNEKGGASQ